jgi:hypothetical protein
MRPPASIGRLRASRTGPLLGLAAALAAAGAPSVGAAEAPTIVACAPGYPGSTVEAQPTLDLFAAAVATAAGLGKGGLRAVYYETEAPGVAHLERADAAFALVPLPFFLKHEKALGLEPRAQAVPEGGEANEVWSLLAGKGRLAGAQGLDGFEVLTLAGYAPRFVAGAALAGFGRVSAGARIVSSGSVLSGLRRAAGGEKVAVLLDRAQAAAVSSLPFAGDLEVVARSAPMPAVLFCSRRGRGAPAPVADAVAKAVLSLARAPGGAMALSAVRIQELVPVDAAALERARDGYRSAPDPP